MTTETPRPERVTCDPHHFVWTWPIEGGSGSVGVCDLCGAVTTGERDAAREQALREEIAQEIEAKYLGPDSGRGYDGRESPDAALRNAYDEGLEMAARIARGETR